MSRQRRSVTEALRSAIQTDGRPISRLAEDSGVAYPVIYRFVKGDRRGLNTSTVDKLAVVLGLELRPIKGRKGR